MNKNQQKIVFFGAPGTGKTTTIQQLKKMGFYCLDEISRSVTADAQKKGITQLFLTKPLLFSELLLEGREKQYVDTSKIDVEIVFFDRGLPEVFGYLNYLQTTYPPIFIEKSKQYKYDKIIHFPIWEKIYSTDNERYESLDEAKQIEKHLLDAYKSLGYQVISVPFGTVEDRVNYILNLLQIK